MRTPKTMIPAHAATQKTRRPGDAEDPLTSRLDELIARIERLESAVRDSEKRKPDAD
jgi:hypothetical protein